MAETAYPDALPAQYRLHWYVLDRVLGQGGFGITYLARDTNLDQPVAIKEYLPVDVATRRADATVRARTDDQGERYRWGLDRFIKEARTLARFDHPNIVRVLSVFEANNTAYMVMRFEEGENLGALLERRRTLPEAELMRVLLPIVDGLALVHGAGFIHRDIKPDNIHIRTDGTPVLLDFGSARLALGQTRTVTILVAPGYAPFEQYYSTGENQGPWTDIYGLGATCYRAISGIAPMDAIARSKGKLGSTQEILVPASAIGRGRYSEGLLKAIDHALEFSEKERPQSLADWRLELVKDKPAPARAGAPAATVSGGSSPAAAPASALPPGASAPTASVTRAVVAGSVIGAIVAVVAVALYLQPGDERKRLTEALERSEADRKRLEIEQREMQKRDAESKQQLEERERRQREEDQRREAAARQAIEQAQAKPEPRAAAKPAPEIPRKRAEAAPAPAARKTEPTRATPAVEPKSGVRMEQPRPAAPAVTESAPAPSPQATAVTPPPAEKSPPAPESPAPARREPLATAAPVPAPAAPPEDRTRALQGDVDAQFRLGEMYESGRGVAQNNFQAYYWYSAAARGGHPAARAKKDQISTRLQPAEIQQADKLVERLARPTK